MISQQQLQQASSQPLPERPSAVEFQAQHDSAGALALDSARMQNLLTRFPTRTAIESLVPVKNIRPRRTRYLGDSVQVGMKTLPQGQATIILELYQFLQKLYGFIATYRDGGVAGRSESDGTSHKGEFDDKHVPQVIAYCHQHDFNALIAQTSKLTAAMRNGDNHNDMRRAFHDIRGGCFTSLVGYFDMIESGYQRPGILERLYSLCRDHLKIMRNAIPDLDPAGYQQDLLEKHHAVALLRDKWSSVLHYSGKSSASVLIDCDFDGWVSDCCMEFAALDRVIYNLVNNATEYALEDVVLMRVLPVNDEIDTHLRFAVMNQITDVQRTRLDEAFEGDFGRLFEGGFTTDGHGLGLRICADIVTDSYGLRSIDEARERGYLGARIIDNAFVAWFHWPAHRDAAGTGEAIASVG